MPLVDRLERKFGWIAIPGVVRLLAGFQLLVFLLANFNPDLLDVLWFSPAHIMDGEVWRLFSFVFIPPIGGMFVIIALMFMWFLGDILEARWGSFRLTLYLIGGIIGMVAGGFLVYFLAPQDIGAYNIAVVNNVVIATSLLLAVGVLYPEIQINLMFVLPIKIMWLALFRGGILLITLIQLVGQPWVALALLLALSNFLLTFGPSSYKLMRQRGEVAVRRRRFEMAKLPENESLHRCETCGKTEEDDPDLEFRVAADGEEYCSEHLPGRPGD